MLFILLAAVISLTNAATVIQPEACTSFPCLILEDEFDFLDDEIWEHEITLAGGGNFEFQAYVNNRSITYTRDSILYIKPGLTSDWAGGEEFLTTGIYDVWGSQGRNDVCTAHFWDGCERSSADYGIVNPVRSGRLRSNGLFSVRYGRIEVNLKIPRGDWIWPAVWMMPQNHRYGAWPSSGEIDIMEARGNEPRDDEDILGNTYAGSTLHWAPYPELNAFPLTTTQYTPSDGTSLADNFHDFAVEWNNETITYYFDGNLVYTVDPGTSFWDFGGFSNERDIHNPWSEGGKMTPFDQKFYILMNVAIGGTGGYFPDGNWSYKPWSDSQDIGTSMQSFYADKDNWYPTWTQGEGNLTSEGAAMQINSLRVWKMSSVEM